MNTECYYCTDPMHSNPFKMDYSPLWFAWRPVITSNGVAFMKKVHKISNYGTQSNFVASWPIVWYSYEEHLTAPKGSKKG